MAGSGPGVEVPQIQPGAQPAQWVEAINALHREVAVLKNEVSVLKAGGVYNMAKDEKHQKDLKDLKSFSSLPTWDGSEKTFGDFEFKLHQFVEPFKNFEKWLDWVKALDTEQDFQKPNGLAQPEHAKDPSVGLHWMNRQIYTVVSLTTTDSPLQTLKGVKESDKVRGALA